MSRKISGALHPIGRTSSSRLRTPPKILLCSSQKRPVLQYFARKRKSNKRYDARLAVIGPGLKLLAFGINHIGVLGDDAKKVLSEQATVLSRQGTYSHSTATRILRTHLSYALHSFYALSVNVTKRHPSPLRPKACF